MLVQEILKDIEYSVTAYHAVERVCSYLKEAGFEQLQENEDWTLSAGGCYYVVRNQSSVMAFKMPQEKAEAFRIAAAHSDSPNFRVKDQSELKGKYYVQLNTEVYGGGILSSWLDRPLRIAGRTVIYNEEEKRMESRLICLDRQVVIPNVAIHFNRQINDGYTFNPQVDLLPLWSSTEGKTGLKAEAAAAAGADEKDILSMDLYLCNPQSGLIWGEEGEYLSVPRYDDLGCVFTALRGFLQAEKSRDVQVLAVFDNEEVGSRTRQGADSDLLESTLRRIAESQESGEGVFRKMLAGSLMVSADNAHSVHPNHPEKTDAENYVLMNKGIVIKFNANQQYTSDSISAGILRRILQEAGVPCQSFANRSDIRGGSTLGNIANSHVSIPTVDIGLAQLAMHSAMETAGSRDPQYMIDGLKAFYESSVRCAGDGCYIW